MLKLSRYAVMNFSYRLCLTWRRVKLWLIFVDGKFPAVIPCAEKHIFFVPDPVSGFC